jgi:hypothetical protein
MENTQHKGFCWGLGVQKNSHLESLSRGRKDRLKLNLREVLQEFKVYNCGLY